MPRSYGSNELLFWLVARLPREVWDECRATTEPKARGLTYEDLSVLLLELALEKESDQHLNAYRPGGGGSVLTMSTSLLVHLGSIMHTVVCTGDVCGCQWLSMVSFGSLEHLCGPAPTQRVYLWLYLVPSEQSHSRYSICFTKEKN